MPSRPQLYNIYMCVYVRVGVYVYVCVYIYTSQANNLEPRIWNFCFYPSGWISEITVLSHAKAPKQPFRKVSSFHR